MLDTLCNVRAMWMPGPHDHYGSEQTSILVRRLEFCCVGTMLGLPAHQEGWMESNAIPLESRVIHRGRVLSAETGKWLRAAVWN